MSFKNRDLTWGIILIILAVLNFYFAFRPSTNSPKWHRWVSLSLGLLLLFFGIINLRLAFKK